METVLQIPLKLKPKTLKTKTIYNSALIGRVQVFHYLKVQYYIMYIENIKKFYHF